MGRGVARCSRTVLPVSNRGAHHHHHTRRASLAAVWRQRLRALAGLSREEPAEIQQVTFIPWINNLLDVSRGNAPGVFPAAGWVDIRRPARSLKRLATALGHRVTRSRKMGNVDEVRQGCSRCRSPFVPATGGREYIRSFHRARGMCRAGAFRRGAHVGACRAHRGASGSPASHADRRGGVNLGRGRVNTGVGRQAEAADVRADPGRHA